MTSRRSGRSARDQRLLLGLSEISGYWNRMETGLRELGVSADFISLDSHRYSYGVERPKGVLVRGLRWVRGRGLGPAGRLIQVVLRGMLLVQCLIRYDVFVFGFRTTFFATRDLWLLRAVGKTVVTVFHGSDERPPYMDGYIDPPDDADLAPLTARQASLLARCDRHSDLVVSNPNSGQLHNVRSMTYHVLGNPVVTSVVPTAGRPGTARDRTIRLLHAPSDPRAKGTDLIREACRDLRTAGVDVELVEVTGVTNAQLHERILECDIVVDQAFGDCTWAMLAAEASLLGRPVVIGGYGHAHLQRFHPEGTVPPAAYCAPEDLGRTIEGLALDERQRLELGREAQRFASERWSPAAVADRLLTALDGNAPDEWFFDPAEIDYPWGGGLSRDEVTRRVRALRARGGPGSFHTGGHDRLQRALDAVAQ